MLEVVSSLSAWPGSARLLRETGLLDQLLGIHASETAGPAAAAAARAVLVRVALHDAASAERVHGEILSKFAFVLPRHRGLDVRALLQRDLLLLRRLCLSPAAALAAVALAGDNGGVGDAGGAGGEGEEEGEGAGAGAGAGTAAATATVVASCWRLHVRLLLDILRRVPAATDDSIAIVNHVALPCLETVAALCLDGVDFPMLQGEGIGGGEDEDDREQRQRGDESGVWRRWRARAAPPAAAAAAAAPLAPGGDELARALSAGRVEDVLLREILRASEGAWAPSASTHGRDGGARVEWVTVAQARGIEEAGRDAPMIIGDHNAMMERSANSSAWRSALHRAGAGTGVAFGGGFDDALWSNSPVRCFPEHWLLRLMSSRQSAVLRTFTGMVIGALAAFKGPAATKEVAEVAAHLVGVIGAEGSEAAGLQVWFRCLGGVHVRVKNSGYCGRGGEEKMGKGYKPSPRFVKASLRRLVGTRWRSCVSRWRALLS